jgi:hypothetical protein
MIFVLKNFVKTCKRNRLLAKQVCLSRKQARRGEHARPAYSWKQRYGAILRSKGEKKSYKDRWPLPISRNGSVMKKMEEGFWWLGERKKEEKRGDKKRSGKR